MDPSLEDVATGVAAGAISAYLERDIDLYQGQLKNNLCVIHAKFLNGNILIGGAVTSLS